MRGPDLRQAPAVNTSTLIPSCAIASVMSDEMIANDLGVEIEDVYEQRAREKEMRDRYDLPDPDAAVAALPDRADEKEADDTDGDTA